MQCSEWSLVCIIDTVAQDSLKPNVHIKDSRDPMTVYFSSTILTFGLFLSGCTTDNIETSTTSTSSGSSTVSETADTGETNPTGLTDVCITPDPGQSLYSTYPDVPADCIDDWWEGGCELEPGYATIEPTTQCNITDGFDSSGAMQAEFWTAYNYGRDYFGAYGPVYVYFLGPTSEESNDDIFRLRGERRAVVDACDSVENQVGWYLNSATQEMAAANNGEPGMFSIAGNTPCHPIIDFVMINPMENELSGITLHEYNHVFQLAHALSFDRESDYGFESWMMEGQATYFTAKFSDLAGWGPDFEDAMMGIKHYGGNITGTGLDSFMDKGIKFQLDNESYWETGEINPGIVYYQFGAWAWAYLIHSVGGDYDIALKFFIADVPLIGKEAAFEYHFGMTIDEFFVEFEQFIQGDDEAWRAILDEPEKSRPDAG